MMIRRRYKLFLIGSLLSFIPIASNASLNFKSQWYFSKQEIYSNPMGISESTIPFSEDESSPNIVSEISLAHLQDRADGLVTWLSEVGASSHERVPVEMLLPESDLVVSLESPEVDPKQRTHVKNEVRTEPLQVIECVGIQFSESQKGSLYVLARDEFVDDIHRCLEANQQHFLWFEANRVIAKIQTLGTIFTPTPMPKKLIDNVVANTDYDLGIWIPYWDTQDEEIDVWIDGWVTNDRAWVYSEPGLGVLIFVDFESAGTKEMSLDNIFLNEQISFLVQYDPDLPQLIVVGEKRESETSTFEVAFSPTKKSTQFLEYYDESVGQFIEVSSGWARLGNSFLPHFFRYFEPLLERDRSFIWIPRGELKAVTFEPQEVLMALRTNKEMGLEFQWDTTADLLVIRSPQGQALPDLHSVDIEPSGQLKWQTHVETFWFEENQMKTQVFVSPPEGQYWLSQSDADEDDHKQVWVIEGMDTLVGSQ
jgi:hypothetical protein